ncbi:MAG: hypothetical protein BGO34_22070 [Bacteroidia bacterium 44-10]|nr:MAG: hypothetical protein BGO34_22070 [Bacteroidia bacterium 44-10]
MIITLVIVLVVITIYFFQAVKTVTKRKIIWWAYWTLPLVLIGLLVYYMVRMATGHSNAITIKVIYWITGLLLLIILPKLIAFPVLLLEDLWRVFHFGINWIKSLWGTPKHNYYSEGRRKFISQFAIGVALVPFTGLLWGIVKGRYEYKVHRVTLRFKDLPEAFHGFTIAQLSDIHAGSFGSAEDVERGVALANQQKSDVVLFTGDLVNNFASEMDVWKQTFSKLKAPYGQYSVMGNHDYGDYSRWESEQARAENLQRVKDVHKEIGFRLLLDENLTIEKEGQYLRLIGVENWSYEVRHRYGNLDKALQGVNERDFKILMSHDPSLWDAEVQKHPQHIHLTLSGHTHGMQMGVEVQGFRWSPAQYMFPQWAGLYEKNKKYIYVNRGFGYISYPGRVGILPEITVITLEKA